MVAQRHGSRNRTFWARFVWAACALSLLLGVGASCQKPSQTPGITPDATFPNGQTPYMITPGPQTDAAGTPSDPEQTPTPTGTEEPSKPPAVQIWKEAEENYEVELDPDTEYWDYPVSQIGHIFFHCLVAYPELDLAVNPNSKWDAWCNTSTEFIRLLDALYERDYILINFHYVYEYREEDGVKKAYLKDTVKLPKGKKGLILSVDNVCYPEDEHGLGRTDKVVVHNGQLASLTVWEDGREEYSTELEAFPILEQFCIRHPDFSFAGAKCMLAVSGYSGILGYRTAAMYASQGYNVQAERTACAEVIAYLKEHGFYFGCHSYSHRDLPKLSGSALDTECRKWNDEVKTLIGYTPIYVYPEGVYADYGSEQHTRLLAEGFHIFLGTEMNEFMRNGMPKHPDVGNIHGNRFIFCGLTLQKYADHPGWFDKYCDPYAIYDNEGRYVKLRRPEEGSGGT